MLRRALVSLLLSVFIGLGAVAPGFAVDGVIEISQASIEAAGGFPMILSQDGSYRLTSNLVVGTDVSAIRVRLVENENTGPKHVTIDLNGFIITGTGSGSADGIHSRATILRVKNGTVERFGGNGINAVGGVNLQAEDLFLGANDEGGIFASTATIRNVTSRNNGTFGVAISAGLVTDSMLINNGTAGLLGLEFDVGYRGCSFLGNGEFPVGPATNLGGNLCPGPTTGSAPVLCP